MANKKKKAEPEKGKTREPRNEDPTIGQRIVERKKISKIKTMVVERERKVTGSITKIPETSITGLISQRNMVTNEKK